MLVVMFVMIGVRVILRVLFCKLILMVMVFCLVQDSLKMFVMVRLVIMVVIFRMVSVGLSVVKLVMKRF